MRLHFYVGFLIDFYQNRPQILTGARPVTAKSGRFSPEVGKHWHMLPMPRADRWPRRAVALSGMSSFGRRARVPYAEPLFGAIVLEPLHLGEPQLCRDAHRGLVGGLGGEHHRLAGMRVGEPVERRCTRLGGVPASPRMRQKHVA